MLFSETLRLLQERLSHVGHETVDEAITVYIVTSICPSENAVHANGPYWLSQLKYLVKKLDLGTEDPTLDEEQNEERRRLWILGEILEYHFLRQQLAFNSDPIFLTSIRNNIQSHLDEWSASFRKHDDLGILNHSTQTNVTTMTNQKCPPRLIYYGNHLFHCLHILLYGPMDLVSMFEDAEWQASPDFIKAGEHAMDCAKVARNILLVDPYLDTMFRFFGTYLLQSTFIFLLLAQKLGSSSDHLILDNCAINLQVLDVFTSVTNMDYQRTFATALRDTISNATDISNTSTSTTPPDERFPNTADNPPSRPQLHPDLLQYRWVGGAKGLWPV
ncbi:putative transcriptional activator xlnr [Phaeomoniella chlamydospora]|uniref:Putative transcriptional activator xlnr n=1 Tax=Phaeomoniella chlamydospora TaxID=158046 RepID=A0A0G2E7D8_PHACM|nr:putative transcriptional activator xlnr [Phaeomoniella chlamydospora]